MMTDAAKAILFDLMVEQELTPSELACAAQYEDHTLPWRSQYEMAPVLNDEAPHSSETE